MNVETQQPEVNGFTLVESLIATFILGIGALALAQVLALGISMNVRSKDDTELTAMATKYLICLKSIHREYLWLDIRAIEVA